MSFRLMSQIFDHSRATGVDRLVLITLAFSCNGKRGDNDTWPSLAKLAKMVNLTVPGLCKSLKRLENTLGEIKRRRSTGGRNIKTHYVICIENSKPRDTVLDELNSVSENTVFKNSISENSKPVGSETVNGRLHALIRNRTGNKDSGAKAPESSSIKRSRKLTRGRAAADPALLRDFERWYLVYPKHVGREPARKAWIKLNPDPALVETIMSATLRYVASKDGIEATFILNPASWLNQKRWTDDMSSSTDGNGHAKPVNVKDIGDGWVEVDGRRMDKRTAERRGFNATA